MIIFFITNTVATIARRVLNYNEKILAHYISINKTTEMRLKHFISVNTITTFTNSKRVSS